MTSAVRIYHKAFGRLTGAVDPLGPVGLGANRKRPWTCKSLGCLLEAMTEPQRAIKVPRKALQLAAGCQEEPQPGHSHIGAP